MPNPQPLIHNGSWQTPSEDMTISPNDVHIWKVSLTPSEHELSVLESLLSRNERDRAHRMKFQQPQQAFMTARGVLRLILSRYLNTEAQSLDFSQGPHGKPFLIKPFLSPPLSFNLSHSHHLALFAFSLNKDVGIDLEYKRRKRNNPSLIQRICSDQEKAIMTSLEPLEQENTLLACWTRKEAYVKATGKGISFPLNSITVSLPPTTPISLLHVDGDGQEPSRWTMHEIQADLDYTAALVVEGNDWHPAYWEWSWNLRPD